jgi:hypothetical protein
MPIFLNNADQEQCIVPKEAIDAMENGVKQFARGDAVQRPRIDNLLPTSRPDEYFCFSSMEGGIRRPGYYALRIKPDIYAWQKLYGKMRETTYSFQPGLRNIVQAACGLGCTPECTQSVAPRRDAESERASHAPRPIDRHNLRIRIG